MKTIRHHHRGRRAGARARRDGDARAAAVTSRRWRRHAARAPRSPSSRDGDASPRRRVARAARRHPHASRSRSDHTGHQAPAERSSRSCAAAALAVNDLGTDGPDPVDYPDIAAAVARLVARRRGRRRHRHRRRRHRIGDRREQDPRHPRRDGDHRDDRALLARAQRRERADARRDAASTRTKRGRSSTTWLGDADAGAALHPPPREDPRSGDADDAVTQRRAAAADRRDRRGAGGAARGVGRRRAAPAIRCCADCCPDRLRGVLDAGATRVGLHAARRRAGRRRVDDRSHAAQAGRDARATSRSCAAKRRSSSSRPSA